MVLVGSGYSPSAVASGAECQLKDKMGKDELDHLITLHNYITVNSEHVCYLCSAHNC